MVNDGRKEDESVMELRRKMNERMQMRGRRER
jgi:hypothetical protein